MEKYPSDAEEARATAAAELDPSPNNLSHLRDEAPDDT
jgi:hypothetical protein